MFNEGDRQNLNVYWFGEDIGVGKAEVGQDWKTAMYALFKAGSDFDFQYKVNSGDLPGVALVVGDKAPEVLNQNWKTAAQFMETNLQVPGYTPVTGQLYTKDN